MTNQSQPLSLKLSNGQELSVPLGKTVLQFTENGQPKSCAVVRGPEGVAVYNTTGDVLVNGASSTAHWLQPGDEIQFSDSLSASVEQLGKVSETLDSLLNEDTDSMTTTETISLEPATPAPVADVQDNFTPATAANTFALEPQPATPVPAETPATIEADPAPVADAQDSFTPATAANTFALEPQPATPVPAETPATIEADPAPVAGAQDSFTPATAANTFALETETATPIPTETPSPIEADSAPVADTQDSFTPATAAIATAASEVTNSDAPAMDIATPAVSAAALAASALATAGIFPNEPDAANESHPQLAEPTGINPVSSAPETAVEEAPTPQPEISNFAADLLARIQSDDNEAVVTSTSETTHSPLADDGFSLPSSVQPAEATQQGAETTSSISSLIPELPPTSVPTPAAETAEVAEVAPSVAETITTESAERQEQSSSVSALLERMKSEGKWDDATEEEEETIEPEAPEPQFAGADEDVQDYMSQLLSRMRDPNAEPQATPVAAAAPKTVPEKAVQEVVEPPKPVGLLKPEEFVPKTKAKRLDSLKDMRALANTQTRTAIDRSQAKRKEAASDYFNIAIAVTTCFAAAAVIFFNIFGSMSFIIGMVTMICGVFFCCKTYFSELVESKKNKANPEQAAASQNTTEESV